MSSRDHILGKLRRAAPEDSRTEYIIPSDQQVFSDYPESMPAMQELFGERLKQLHGELFVVADETGAGRVLDQLLTGFPERSCLVFAPKILDKLINRHPGLNSRFADDRLLAADSQTFGGIAAGITTAEFLVARSGSIVLSASGSGGRRLSVLPPLHIVLAYTSQLVPSLDAALSRLSESSYITIISGPSRTSDIEKKLVLGAHGPKRLVVILIGSE